ncbi:hypothetical protein [Pandoravirus japonicus]|uniref:Uncharacterized protein n=1 Tax=Pandoravirus japonicus TaxID=2823154 RepID=A0A811BRM0_9VIRU|nr:hypothetical protein [Pandoravirus japonicus]
MPARARARLPRLFFDLNADWIKCMLLGALSSFLPLADEPCGPSRPSFRAASARPRSPGFVSPADPFAFFFFFCTPETLVIGAPTGAHADQWGKVGARHRAQRDGSAAPRAAICRPVILGAVCPSRRATKNRNMTGDSKQSCFFRFSYGRRCNQEDTFLSLFFLFFYCQTKKKVE